MTVLLPSSVAGANLPLVLSVVAFVVVYALAHPKWRRLRSLELLTAGSPQRRVLALWLLLYVAILLLVMGLCLETYHAYDCPNSALFQLEIDALARWVYEFCARNQVPYWLMFGNGLFVLRGNDRIPVGDTDSDIAIEKGAFLSKFSSIEGFTKAATMDATMELQRDVHIVYLEDRELLQIFLNPELFGSHADIWLYKTEGTDATTLKPKFLVNEDRTIRAKKLPYEEIMPLQEQSGRFLGTTVSLARNPEFLAKAEYGSSYMTPLVTRLECMENVWNGYAFYKTPHNRQRFLGFLVFTSSSLTLLLAYCVGSLNAVLLQSRRNKHKRKASNDFDGDGAVAETLESHGFLDKDVV